jgi:hypothetical protein
MVHYWNNNHNKYLILGHRLLAGNTTYIHWNFVKYVKIYSLSFQLLQYISGVNGWLPERLRNEMMWNSTANLVGKPGHNIALDLVNEFLNNEFKGKYKLLMYFCFSLFS